MFTVYVKFVICMTANAGMCLDQQIQYPSDQALTPQACMMQAMPRLAKWFEDKPQYEKWRVAKFSCVTKKDIDA